MDQSVDVQPNKKTIRIANVLLLEREIGSRSALARKVGSSQSYLSQCVGKGGVRSIGDDLARRLETAMEKPQGWMDECHIDAGHLAAARQIHDKLLQAPRAQLEAVAALLGIDPNATGSY
ncbi:hypothetical protein [Cupriavidus campinensis]|uniref:hypothetical protein n=1 Tax=Cupriavidus campinensis TaxID=151783 RepID=UPI0011EBBA19|nr:hypothetical protein [Cupriavidus campinensis]